MDPRPGRQRRRGSRPRSVGLEAAHRADAHFATQSTSHLIRKLVPNLRAPGAVGGAGCRWQYPDPGIGNRFDLLAVISLTAQKFLSCSLAGKGEKLRPAREDRCT